ncbi:hypothetical protein [Aeromonas hydrophila]|uniref:hypothetical protein n=1 Tax=Aeromonas hydrophila TaxID=644 RepID=UPI00126A5842|nr:hypothetical protein [Aeromonas hydrophila]
MKKKFLIATAALGAMGFVNSVSANVASQVFSWTGSVPAASTDGAWIIKSPHKNDVDSGILVFKAEGDKGVLTSSSDLAFNVFDYTANPTVGDAASNYSYQLTSLAINSNGLAQEQGTNGYFEIRADGVALEKDVAKAKASGGNTVLTVAPTTATSPSNQPAAGDDVNIQATIVITTAA